MNSRYDNEKILIGQLLYDPSSIDRVKDFLQDEDFDHAVCRWCYRTISRARAAGEEITPQIVLSKVPPNRNRSRWVDFLTETLDQIPTTANVLYFGRKIREESIKRRMLTVLDNGADPDKLSDLTQELKRLEGRTGSPGHSFTLVKASDLAAEPMEDVQWLLDEVLPQGGMSLLVAKPKVGKSTLALNLSVAVASGRFFLGRRTAKVPVVYLALEEKRDELKRRLRSLCPNQDLPLHLYLGVAPEKAMQQIPALVSDIKAGLLVVDTMQKLTRIRDLNDYGQVTLALEKLLAVARAHNCHVLLTHHAGKMERTDGDEILGSTALLGAVDTAIILKKREQGRTMSTVQRYGNNVPETVIQLREDYSLCVSESLEDAKNREVWEEIKIFLEANPGVDRNSIVEEVDARRADILKTLQWAIRENLICREGSGKKGDPYRYFIEASEKVVPGVPAYTREPEKQKIKNDVRQRNDDSFSGSRKNANSGISEPDSGTTNFSGSGGSGGSASSLEKPDCLTENRKSSLSPPLPGNLAKRSTNSEIIGDFPNPGHGEQDEQEAFQWEA
jgi:hypothetical protein